MNAFRFLFFRFFQDEMAGWNRNQNKGNWNNDRGNKNNDKGTWNQKGQDNEGGSWGSQDTLAPQALQTALKACQMIEQMKAEALKFTINIFKNVTVCAFRLSLNFIV